jgi:hypothetical protein
MMNNNKRTLIIVITSIIKPVLLSGILSTTVVHAQGVPIIQPLNNNVNSLIKATTKKPVVIVSQNAFTDDNQYYPTYRIVGEVENNGTQSASFVQISATLYDSNNQVIGTGFTYAKPSTIEPGMKAPFEITISKSSVKDGDFSAIDHYSVQVG